MFLYKKAESIWRVVQIMEILGILARLHNKSILTKTLSSRFTVSLSLQVLKSVGFDHIFEKAL